MTKSWTVAQKLALGFAFPVMMLVILGVLSQRSTQAFLDTSREVQADYEMRLDLGELIVSLRKAELAGRGLLITGQDGYLNQYRANVAAVEKEYERLHGVITDPRQMKALEELQPEMEERLAFITRLDGVRRREGIEIAAKMLAASNSEQGSDAIQKYLDGVENIGKENLAAHQNSYQLAAWWMKNTLWIGTGATLLIVVIAGYLMIRGLDRQIGTAVQHMQSASTELQAAATQQSKGAKGQVAAATEVSTTIQELVSTSRQIAESAQHVTQIAGETAVGARDGGEIVRGAQQAMEGLRRQMDRIVAHMLDLGKKSQEVGSILEIINELAEQTNILSINATIEAAGAGESGRRFAVVADEIRKLADRVSTSAKEIRALIEDMRAAANTTVLSTEDGSKAVDVGARRFADVTESFSRIARHVENTAQSSREIELSTKQQRTAVEQVNIAMSDVARAARDTEASSGQTLRTAGELAVLSQRLVQLIRRDTGHHGGIQPA